MGSYNSLEHLDRNWEQLSAVSRKWGRPSNGQKLPEVSLSTVKSFFDILWYFRCRGFNVVKHFYPMGGSPGLVVMGGDSCSKSREFKSWHRILDGRFFHLFVVKIIMCVWKDENKWKRGRGWPIKKHFTPSYTGLRVRTIARRGYFLKGLLETNFLAKKIKYLTTFWAILKNITF